MVAPTDIRHLDGSAPRIMVVDGSRLVRKLIGDVLLGELPGAEVVSCAGLAEAHAALAAAPIDLATTSLVLPDGDGQQLAEAVRAAAGQRYVPVVVVSGNAQEHLESRRFSDDVTDYFDKSHGHRALAEFIRGYVQPAPIPGARVLYVEDSRTVALATSRMLKSQQMEVEHVTSVEAALDSLQAGADAGGGPGVDLVLTDVYLKGELDGGDLVQAIRGRFGWSQRRLPVLVMTGAA
ncbi:MAG: response regulator, partial [Gammaproteobacteria bacterium]|nr:response regulator [Gammaproteobacteria bacterium]